MNEDNLQGLMLPPEVAGFNFLLWLSILLGTCLIVILLWLWKRHRKKPSTIALKRLDLLNQENNAAQQSKFVQLVSILCQGLNIKRLDQYEPENTDAWNAFQEKLESACYSTNPKESFDAQLFDTLLVEAKLWLHDGLSGVATR